MTRVVVVGDIRLYRDGLAQVLDARPQLAVVGTAGSAAETLAAARRLEPDVILLDTAMADGLATLRRLGDAAPGARVVALGVPDRESEVLAVAEAGAAGYVTRDASLDEVVETIESVGRGETICSPRMAATLLRHVALLAAERDARPEALLTARELEVVALIDDGLSNKEIGQRLCIELPTVKNHVHNILEKLNVARRSEAAARLRGRYVA